MPVGEKQGGENVLLCLVPVKGGGGEKGEQRCPFTGLLDKAFSSQRLEGEGSWGAGRGGSLCVYVPLRHGEKAGCFQGSRLGRFGASWEWSRGCRVWRDGGVPLVGVLLCPRAGDRASRLAQAVGSAAAGRTEPCCAFPLCQHSSLESLMSGTNQLLSTLCK